MIPPEVTKYMSEISKKGWKDLSKEERSAILKDRGAKGRKNRWAYKTPEQRRAHSLMMLEKKYGTKRSKEKSDRVSGDVSGNKEQRHTIDVSPNFPIPS
jgi:hypothetical protein